MRTGYYNYFGPRTFFRDGWWFGLADIKGVQINKVKRLQKYPNFKCLEDLDEFRSGYVSAGKSLGLEITWEDYETCRKQIRYWGRAAQ